MRRPGSDLPPEEKAVAVLIAVAFGSSALALLWGAVAFWVDWLMRLSPAAFVRLAGLAGLLVGSALIFVALVHVERHIHPSPDPNRGRRPIDADTREARRFGHASGLPPVRVDVAHGPTAPPPAGGRALPRPSNGRYPWPDDAGLTDEDFDRLCARGMGRTVKGPEDAE